MKFPRPLAKHPLGIPRPVHCLFSASSGSMKMQRVTVAAARKMPAWPRSLPLSLLGPIINRVCARSKIINCHNWQLSPCLLPPSFNRAGQGVSSKQHEPDAVVASYFQLKSGGLSVCLCVGLSMWRSVSLWLPCYKSHAT